MYGQLNHGGVTPGKANVNTMCPFPCKIIHRQLVTEFGIANDMMVTQGKIFSLISFASTAEQ